MRILEYKIPSQLYVKAEITKLTPLPIPNNTDKYYLVIPSLNSTLADNVMFIQETLLIPPHTTLSYTPKIVKLGVTLSESLATSLPKGIEIKILILDNIDNEISAVTESTSVRVRNTKKSNNNANIPVDVESLQKMSVTNNTSSYISDGKSYKVDKERSGILSMIDNAILEKEQKDNKIDDNAHYQNSSVTVEELNIPIVGKNNDDQEEHEDEKSYQSSTIPTAVKRGRGRPRKVPLVAQEALQSLTQSE